MKTAEIERKTKETSVKAQLELGTNAKADISTGVGFFDHMLTALAIHSGISLTLTATGDLEVDCHHSVEDVGIVLGQLFCKALGDKGGIARYGSSSIPMDEALATASLDISARPYLVFNAEFKSYRVGDFETQMVEEFFRAFAFNAGITLHINVLYGSNDHHKIEAIFKSVAHALKMAIAPSGNDVLSTKGVL